MALAIRHLNLKNPPMYLFIVTTVCLYATMFDCLQIPGERIYLAEYGLPAFLLYRTLRFRFSLHAALPAAFGITDRSGMDR